MNMIDNVSNYLKSIPPVGDGLYGVETTPFLNLLTRYYNPQAFSNFHDYAYELVGKSGKPAATKAGAMSSVTNLPMEDQVIIDDIAKEILDHTRQDSNITLIREFIRSGYVSKFARPQSSLAAEMDIRSTQQLTPENLINFMSSFLSVSASLEQKRGFVDDINACLFPLLKLVKSTGNPRLYSFVLSLCNLAESYYSLASSIQNIASAAAVFAPQNMQIANNSTVGGISVGNVDTVTINAQTDGYFVTIEDKYNYFLNVINSAPSEIYNIIGNDFNSYTAILNAIQTAVSNSSSLPLQIVDNIIAISKNQIAKIAPDEFLMEAIKTSAKFRVMNNSFVIGLYLLSFYSNTRFTESIDNSAYMKMVETTGSLLPVIAMKYSGALDPIIVGLYEELAFKYGRYSFSQELVSAHKARILAGMNNTSIEVPDVTGYLYALDNRFANLDIVALETFATAILVSWRE